MSSKLVFSLHLLWPRPTCSQMVKMKNRRLLSTREINCFLQGISRFTVLLPVLKPWSSASVFCCILVYAIFMFSFGYLRLSSSKLIISVELNINYVSGFRGNQISASAALLAYNGKMIMKMPCLTREFPFKFHINNRFHVSKWHLSCNSHPGIHTKSWNELFKRPLS